MTDVAIFIPTKRYGGIDIIEASLKRQTYKNFTLYVCDELERNFYWERIGTRLGFDVTCIHPPWFSAKTHKRNLARSYNIAAEDATNDGADLFVSLQDYIWLPEDGLERFVKNYEANGDRYLYTGLTSISSDPGNYDIYDPCGSYTIFKEPYTDRPKLIAWKDIRATTFYNGYFEAGTYILTIGDPNHFEANWAAIPTSLFEEGLRWDEEYDKGVACENNQLALDAITSYGCQIILDGKNHAISLPHRDYFDEGEIGSEANSMNMNKFEENFKKAREGRVT